jgi:L-lactate dehydrogenase
MARKTKSIETTRVAIVGVGNVGATVAFSLMIQGIASEIVLIDVNKNKCIGEALDLMHGISFVKPVRIWCGDYKECQNADVVIISAGLRQKTGQTRLKLAKPNAKIISKIVKNITQYTKKAIILVVTNPVDVMTYVALKVSKMPKNQVFGTGTNLDSSRFRWLLSEKFGVAATSVHAFLIGEHGDSAVPVFSHANVMGKNIMQFPEYTLGFAKEVYKKVIGAAYEIINKKGATFYAPALNICEIIRAILYDENHILLVSSLLTGQYGLRDVCLSLPAVIGRKGIKKIIEIDLTPEELNKLRKSAQVIRDVISKFKLQLGS